MIEQVPAMIVLLDKQGRIAEINQMSEEVLSIKKGEAYQKNFFEMFARTAEKSAEYEAQFRSILASKMKGAVSMEPVHIKGKSIEWTVKVLRAGKKRFSRALSSSEVELPEIDEDSDNDDIIETYSERSKVIALCLGTDITANLQRERLIWSAKEEAEKLSQLKDAFVANVSHELR